MLHLEILSLEGTLSPTYVYFEAIAISMTASIIDTMTMTAVLRY